jgi:exosortase E/protease (VPEID-CTERM system)
LRGLVGRLLLLALIFFLEKVFLDQFVDFDLADNSQGLGATLRAVQHWGFRFVTVFAASVLVFAFAWTRAHAEEASATPFVEPRGRWIVAHLLSLAIMAGLSHSIYRTTTNELSVALVAGAGVIVGIAVVATALLALARVSVWLDDVRSLGTAWVYAAIIAGFATGAIGLLQTFWRPASALTLYLVAGLLKPILPTLETDPSELILNSGRFAIQIADACSGLEGVGLMLAFSTIWLIYFRGEYRFPRSLWIVPIGVVIIFGLNSVRIAALLLIGHAGYPDVALFGFHSQAGWIAFIIAAGSVVLLSRRPIFLRVPAVSEQAANSTENPTAAFLIPLLAIVSAGMLSRATSGQAEVLYPLRFVAGLSALWIYRNELRRGVDWRITWRGPVAGAALGVLAAITAHFLPPAEKVASLVTLPLLPRLAWMIASCGAAVFASPIAEELAFRGYLMRRLTRQDFEAVPFTSVRWPAVFLSAVAFAAIQGSFFVPSALVGIAYGALVVHNGKFGDAVVAHAITNGAVISVAWQWT